MSVVFQKKADGTLKAWIVSVRRNSQIYTKYFRPNQYEEALNYHEYLLSHLPPITRSGPKKGVNCRKPKKLTTSIQINNCILTKSLEGSRCKNYELCSNFNTCLTEVAKRDWAGFKN